MRAVSIFIAMSANMNCMPWNAAIGLPNCSRSLHVADREVERALRDAQSLRRDRRTREVERPHRVLEALVDLADHVLGRNAHAVEDDLARGRAADAHLVFLATEREALHVLVDEEAR